MWKLQRQGCSERWGALLGETDFTRMGRALEFSRELLEILYGVHLSPCVYGLLDLTSSACTGVHALFF